MVGHPKLNSNRETRNAARAKSQVFESLKSVWLVTFFCGGIPFLNAVMYHCMYRSGKVWRNRMRQEYGLSILPRLWVVEVAAIAHFLASMFWLIDAILGWMSVGKLPLLLVLFSVSSLVYVIAAMAGFYVLCYGCYRATGESHILDRLRMFERLCLFCGGMYAFFGSMVYLAGGDLSRIEAETTSAFIVLLLIFISIFLGILWIMLLGHGLAEFCRTAPIFDPQEFEKTLGSQASDV